MQIITKLLADLSVTTAKIAALAVTTAKIAANAVTGAKILLANMEYLRGRNAADTADIDMARVDASDEVQANGRWKFNSLAPRTSVAPTVGDDLCNKTYVDAQVSAGVDAEFENHVWTAAEILAQSFTLAFTPIADSAHHYVSGVAQLQGSDYTIAGNVLTLTPGGDLATGGAAELVAGDVSVVRGLV